MRSATLSAALALGSLAPAGFAASGIYLRPGGRGAPIPWNVYVPAP